MKIKTATKFAFIGAIILVIVQTFYFLLNAEIISIVNEGWDYKVYKVINCMTGALQIYSAVSFATFFGVLHKNQK